MSNAHENRKICWLCKELNPRYIPYGLTGDWVRDLTVPMHLGLN